VPPAGAFADESIVMDAGRRLANVMIAIDGLPKTDYKVDQADLRIRAFQYRPRLIRVPTSAKVRIQNDTRDNVNVTANSSLNPKWNILLEAGKAKDFEWDFEEVVEITDQVHPWMKALVVVTGNPFGAVTGSDGLFEIANLPAGKWTLKLWHEKLGELRKKIEIVAGRSFDMGEVKLGSD